MHPSTNVTSGHHSSPNAQASTTLEEKTQQVKKKVRRNEKRVKSWRITDTKSTRQQRQDADKSLDEKR